MLVIISDLHLTDGSVGTPIDGRAFKVFRQRLRDMAYDASWRHHDSDPEGRYKPIERFDVLLLGDVFDVLRSDQWPAVAPTHPDYVRPWHANSPDPQKHVLLDKTVTQITDKILINYKSSLAVFKGLVDQSDPITLPPAERGKAAECGWEPTAEGRVPVEVRIHYMVGNHDWFYHLPGKTYDAIRQSIIDAMGLANPADQPFPHDPSESATIRKLMEEHQVFARHGDIYDPFNFEGSRDASSLGDAIVVDLLNRFPGEVKRCMRKDLPAATLQGLEELDNVRPLAGIPIWIEGLLTRTCSDLAAKRKVKKIWNELADEFIKSKFVKTRDSWRPLELVDKLQATLKFSSLIPLPTIGWLATGLGDIIKKKSYSEFALTERDFKNRRARFIVYGHTHQHEIVPLDSSYGNQGRFDQIYLNSGTWRRVHEQAVANPSEQEFMDWDVMTYLAFFKEGERFGRFFETWSGTLCPEH